MSKMEKNGMEKLAKVLDLRMGEHSGGGFSFDFGVIKKDYSLVSNTFPLPIPKKDYSVCRLLANLSTNVSGGTHGGHNSGTGSHSHKVVIETTLDMIKLMNCMDISIQISNKKKNEVETCVDMMSDRLLK